MNHVVCLDFETGGLDCQKAAVTEVGMVAFRLDTFEDLATYQSYVSPYKNRKVPKNVRTRKQIEAEDDSMAYEEKALNYSNITMDQLINHGKPLEEVVNGMIETFKKANVDGGFTKKPMLLGQNFGFDIGFLQQAFAFCKEELNKYVDGKMDYFGNFQPTYFDTLYLSKSYFALDEDANSHKLELVCDRLGIELIAAHSALADVYATKEVFMSYMNKMRTGSAKGGKAAKEIRAREHFKF